MSRAEKVLDVLNEALKTEVERILDKNKFSYKKVEVDKASKEVRVVTGKIAMGKAFDKLEDQFNKLFPGGKVKGMDIYLQGEG